MSMNQSMFVRMPEILGGAVCRVAPGERFYFPLHQHDGSSELLLIVEGEGDFRVDGNLYHAKAGSLMCYNRGIWHEELSSGDKFLAIYVGYKGLQLKGLPSDYLVGTERSAMIELNEYFVPIKQLFSEMITEWLSSLPESAAVANQLFGVLLGKLVRLLYYTGEDEVRKRPAKESVHMAKRFMEENYYTDVNLTMLANLTHTNAYHFIHVFKLETGLSPIQYLIRYRMEVAKQYLVTTRLSMTEIAEKVGYSSETYFQNLFKKTIGTSPGKYRSVYREGREE
ncbi:AraC family transcriptional regulator [Cohnella silvisoli]|uniref:AraC family transcriptional regulator n=1 Tax=Cohnella silvisoli TaxID=2873699 RepID=A0ABV1KW97_9BACL|nr:AraC family transcriptional regulator [Cohnella silvisoli]MCD9024014.1 AraC family transcriptional regulator [Cohnella silvisoli]